MKKQTIASVVAVMAALSAGAAWAAEDTLSKINKAGKVVMGVREASIPLSYKAGENKYTGYQVELCEQVLKNIAPKAKIEYLPLNPQNRIPLLKEGKVDLVCGSSTNTLERQKEVAFSLTTYITEVRMAVKANSNIHSISDLKDKTVVTTHGTTSVDLLHKHHKAQGIQFNELYTKDHAESFRQLEMGRADAFVMNDDILAGLIANAKNPKAYRIEGGVLSTAPIAVMLPKDDKAFKNAVDGEIAKMMKDGSLAKLYAKWFTKPIPPKNANVNMPMSAALVRLFKAPNDKPAEAYVKK